MTKRIKKISNRKEFSDIFKDIDTKLLIGWECLNYSTKQKKSIEKIKMQTQLAMENQKYESI
tara:strand:+ start:627 stop:812 length:186 start_codon:yes stop_codon:yes gene_type:complete